MSSPFTRKLSYGKKILLAAAAVVAIAVPIAVGLINAPRGSAQTPPGVAVSSAPAHAHGPEETGQAAQPAAPPAAAPAQPDHSTDAAPLEFEAASVKTSLPGSANGVGIASLLPVAGSAQSFEVASIKPAPSLEEMVRSRQMHLGVNVDPAFADIGAFSLADLVGYAFRIRPFQISGPEWLNGQRFDIRAKLPDGATVDQVPEMVQSLLVERFHLTFHLENKEYPVYALLVGPKGPKLTVCPPDYERPAHGDVIPMTLARYADAISALFDRPVIDRTELQGTYLLSVGPVGRGLTERWAARAKTPTQNDTAPQPSASEPGDSALSAVLADLGLRVEARKLPLPFLVVDRIEKQPTEQ